MHKILDVFRRISEALLDLEVTQPVADHCPPNELIGRLDFSLSEDPIDDEVWERAVKDIVLASPRTATKGFFNQLFGGRNDKATLGDLLAVLLNNGMHTYKSAGVQIGVEKIILQKVCDMIGWDTQASGTLAPGGSMSNFMALIMARDRADDAVRAGGVTKKMTIYTSEESHYSIAKNASFSGIGRDQVRYIPTDAYGCIRVDLLEDVIQKDIADGYMPTMINLTSGTTVLGAFDPLRDVAKISSKYHIWLHADGAYCGAALWSARYKHLLDGVELLDSFSVNPHKMIGTPLSCSIIVVKDKKYMYNSFANDASYLYQTDQDEYNPGKISLQCGRRNDALKFWTLWKSVGSRGIAEIVEHQFALADTARDYIRSHPDYTLYSFDNSISICFNYKDVDPVLLCTSLYKHSKLMVGYGSFKGKTFVRLVTVNNGIDHDDIRAFFETIEKHVASNSSLHG